MDGLEGYTWKYRTINVLRSALSSIHPKIDSYCVGQHPYVINLMWGILNSRLLPPRFAYTWDLCLLTRYVKGFGVNNALSPKQLSWKLAILFAITCPKRVFSVASLDLNHHDRDLLLLLLSQRKEPDSSSLCPVDCLKHYYDLTKQKRKAQQGKTIRLFISYVKLHPITKATICR